MTVTWADDPDERRRGKADFELLDTPDLVSSQRELREQADVLIAGVSAHLRSRPVREVPPPSHTEP